MSDKKEEISGFVNEQQKHEQSIKLMATPEFFNELIALLKSRTPLIYLTCNEEKRMLTYFEHLASARGYKVHVWDCYEGLRDLSSNQKSSVVTEDITQAAVVLDHIIEQAELSRQNAGAMKKADISGYIYILLDFHRFIEDADPDIERRLKRISQIESMVSVITTAPSYISTPSLENEFTLIDFPYPNKEEISIELDSLVHAISEKQGKLPYLKKELKENRNSIIQAANGLTCKEAQRAFSKSLVMHKSFDISTILKEKQQIIRKHGVLEFYEPKITIDDIGGLGEMVKWLKLRKNDFTQDAKDFNIPDPKGLLVLGFPGCVLGTTKIKIKKIKEEGKHDIHIE